MYAKGEVPWLGGTEEARKRLGGPVLLGLLKIDENRLGVEVNSKQRVEFEILDSRVEEIWWFDVPVPALNDMTPREGVETEVGRDLLESLLLLYENNSDDSSDNLMRPDILAFAASTGNGVVDA